MAKQNSSFFTNPEAHFSCTGCGRCCRGWNIELSDEENTRISQPFAPWARRGKGRNLTLLKTGVTGKPISTFDLVPTQDKPCPMLEDNICSLWHNHGVESIPATCQIYPFRYIDTPNGTLVGLSFSCEAVVDDFGTPMQAQIATLERTNTLTFPSGESESRKARSITAGQECVLHEGVSLTWNGYLAFEDLCRQWLADRTMAIAHRLEKVLAAVYSLTQFANATGLVSVQDADVRTWATILTDFSLPERARADSDRECAWAQFALVLNGDTLIPSVRAIMHGTGRIPIRRDGVIATVDLGEMQHVTLDEGAIESINETLGRYCRNYVWEKRPFATSVESAIRDLLMYVSLIAWYARMLAWSQHQSIATHAHVRLAIIELERDTMPARCRDRTQTCLYSVDQQIIQPNVVA